MKLRELPAEHSSRFHGAESSDSTYYALLMVDVFKYLQRRLQLRSSIKRLRNVVADSAVRVAALALPAKVICDPRYFRVWESCGYHITQASYYSPIPKFSEIPDDLWDTRSQLVGIQLSECAQLDMLQEFSRTFRTEYEALPRERQPGPPRFYLQNGMFVSVDAEILYCMIRSFKPRRILETGSGQSTLLAAEAVLRNQADNPSYACELVAVEPYPVGFLRKGFPGLSRLMVSKVQDVALAEFELLEKNDILFVDSSHVASAGSDVNFLIFEVLPRIKPGVIVHFHDIFLPSEYPKAWIKDELRFWNEQYIVRAFLTFNSDFEILWGGHYMHQTNPDALSKAFGSYDNRTVSPASFWIRRVG